MRSGLTKRGTDFWESAASRSTFLASGFSCSQAESTPLTVRLGELLGGCNGMT